MALLKQEAQRVENNLRRAGHAVAGIHGDLSQQDRIASLNSFKSASTPLLVATGEFSDSSYLTCADFQRLASDVAARGLDIPKVELVINYTFPLSEYACPFVVTIFASRSNAAFGSNLF